jgi:hypothetical protein
MKKPKEFQAIFDEMVIIAGDKPVCHVIEKSLQPIFAPTHSFMSLHLENPGVLYRHHSPSSPRPPAT